MSDEKPFIGRYFLVVDDEVFIQQLLVRLLKGLGAAQVEVAADGPAAIRIVKESDYQFDCVITDFAMTPMTGLQFLQAIRCGDHGLKRNMPVAMLTAHADSNLVAAARALDANAFIVKPPTREAMVGRLAKALERGIAVKPPVVYKSVPLTAG
ncbi:MAG: response regulator [Alphaproteobacteria bacterium]|nr:response regulator [Alphaproteobacteria bacterium]